MCDCFTKCTLANGTLDKKHDKCSYCQGVVLANSSKNETTSMWAHERKMKAKSSVWEGFR